MDRNRGRTTSTHFTASTDFGLGFFDCGALGPNQAGCKTSLKPTKLLKQILGIVREEPLTDGKGIYE